MSNEKSSNHGLNITPTGQCAYYAFQATSAKSTLHSVDLSKCAASERISIQVQKYLFHFQELGA